jgi:hypothetical protein
VRSIIACALAAGCSASPAPQPGEVSVTDDGGDVAHVTACLDSDIFGCHGSDLILTVIHDHDSSAMTYGAFGAGFHAVDMPLGDPATGFLISDGIAQVIVHLPTPFEISGMADGTLTRDGHLRLTWDRDTAPMRWDWDYECGPTVGGGEEGGELDDDGSASFDMSEITDVLDSDVKPDTDTCDILIKLSRFARGTVDTAFHAKTATGIQLRSVKLTLAR